MAPSHFHNCLTHDNQIGKCAHTPAQNTLKTCTQNTSQMQTRDDKTYMHTHSMLIHHARCKPVMIHHALCHAESASNAGTMHFAMPNWRAYTRWLTPGTRNLSSKIIGGGASVPGCGATARGGGRPLAPQLPRRKRRRSSHVRVLFCRPASRVAARRQRTATRLLGCGRHHAPAGDEPLLALAGVLPRSKRRPPSP